MPIRRALLALALLALTGCHLGYDVTNVPGATEYRDVSIALAPTPVSASEPATIGRLTVTRDARTYVASREVHYARRLSLFRDWTDEHIGFRTTVWWYGHNLFPITSSVIEGTNKDDMFLLILITCGAIIDIPLIMDIFMYIGTPLLDSLTILGSGLADLLTGGLSAPPILIKAAIDGRNPDPGAEVYTSRQETVAGGSRAFTYSFSVADAPGGAATENE
jgi:hypothetical protein